jgi:DNA processing protein
VSGLAKGVDSEAHREALDAQTPTVAILANGLDKVYPRENAKLADQIVSSGGALMSEQGFGVPATANNLVQRDRLQSGMSIATFVMQTDLIGGSMHTVRFTLMQRRLLYAPVPTGQHADNEKSRGIVALTTETGTSLINKLKTPPTEYRDLLRSVFANRPPARPIRSKNDYDSVISELESSLAGITPLDNHQTNESRKQQQQLF